MLSASQKQQVSKLFNSLEKHDEFEVMFNNYRKDNKLALSDFMNVMNYLKWRNNNNTKNTLKENVLLDISYSPKKHCVYRFSIANLANINNFLGLVHQRKNNVIFSTLVTQYLDKEGFSLIQKEKDVSNIVDINDYDIRFRKSQEKGVDAKKIKELEKLPLSASDSITYRYKQRLTLQLTDNLAIDLTIVKTSTNISNLATGTKSYELEIDYMLGSSKVSLDTILEETEKIKKILTNSEILITKEEEDLLIKKYISKVYDVNRNQTMIYSMQPINTEVQHFIDNIPNKYAVTDKADGDKYQLFIQDNMYLISCNLHVRKLPKVIKELNDTILEGELIYLSSIRKYVFMVYDVLFFNNKDIRNTSVLKERYDIIMKVCEKINGHATYRIKEYDGSFDLKKVKTHYESEIKQFYTNFNKDIDHININQVLVYPKLFLFPSGGSNSEVYLFSDLIWSNYKNNEDIKTNITYELDGIIFTGLNQKYTKDKKDQKYPIFKYKPPHTNSLDVYIIFEKNTETGGYMDIFDNSLPDTIEYKTYRVVNIFVGESSADSEHPVPFMKEENNHQIYLPIIDGQVRDMKGNIVQDKTVIEISYKVSPKLPHQYRWNVIRTRWDKTEQVFKYGKKYGNYKDAAIRIWKSMKEAITINDIKSLANPDTYGIQMKVLASRIDSSVITSQRQQDIYYQKRTNLIKKMREFNNWIKSIIIYTFCSPGRKERGGKVSRKSMLDIGCGRGGDLMKIYHARVGEYVGFDTDYEGIYSISDGAISRYNYLKSKYPDFGKVTYLQADGGILLEPEIQSRSLGNLSNENKKRIETIFTKDRKFDIISSQFCCHYLFGTQTSIENLIKNIDTFLTKDGYVLLTLFDAELIDKTFGDNNKITSYYTDEEGQRNILYEIVKKYDGKLSDDVGKSINVHMSWISDEGKYIEEFIVSRNLMINTMKKANCRLVDTDLFSNLYHLNKPYFQEVIKYEENPKNKQFYEKVASFYGDLKGADKESRNFSFLSRYYVFQKN